MNGRTLMLQRDEDKYVELDFAPPERSTLNDQVYREMRRLIMSGKLRPGQAVSIRNIAGAIGVSPMPVRDALQRLVTEGALHVLPNRTFALPVLNRDNFRELTDIRIALEGMAAKTAAPSLDEDDIKALRNFNSRMFSITNKNIGDYLDLNQQFHFRIYRAARQERLLRIIETLWLQAGPLLNIITDTGDFKPAKAAHDAIIEAAISRNPRKLRLAVERDLSEAAKVIIDRMDK